MQKLLFIAGEPGAGKTEGVARPLSESNVGLVLHSDRISGQASRYYPSKKPLQNKWQLWKLEFDQAHKADELSSAYSEAIHQLYESPLLDAQHLIVEGVLCGHPVFRQTIKGVFAAIGLNVDQEMTLALCPPWEQVHANMKKRGREKEQDAAFVLERSRDYNCRLDRQEGLVRCTTTAECYEAAKNYFLSEIE